MLMRCGLSQINRTLADNVPADSVGLGMITRREVLTASVGGIAAAATFSAAAQAGNGRNIVFIMVDDLLSVAYNRQFGLPIRTPHLNRLMAQGIYFSKAFASTAVCNPSRTAILSGKNPFKTGVHVNPPHWERFVDPRATFPGIMAAAGYRCFLYGKISHFPEHDGPVWENSGVCIEARGLPHESDDPDRKMVDAAIARLQNLRRPTRPWMLMLGLIGPHLPVGQFPELFELYPKTKIVPQDWDGDRVARRCFLERIQRNTFDRFTQIQANNDMKGFYQRYFADITKMDRDLGRFLDALDASGVESTVILASDHGYHLGSHDAVGKFTLWDEAGRAPLVMRYGGCPAGLVISEVVSLLDIGPTILHRVGIAIPQRFDGQSLLPLITDPVNNKRTNGALTTMGNAVSLRENRYRITRYDLCEEIELFDQEEDPYSTTNLAFMPGYETLTNEMLAKLGARVAEWKL